MDAVHCFGEARRAFRAFKRNDKVALSQGLDDCLLCEAWGVSQAALDDISEEEILMRKLVSHARSLEEGS